jgi:hypothetical protein
MKPFLFIDSLNLSPYMLETGNNTLIVLRGLPIELATELHVRVYQGIFQTQASRPFTGEFVAPLPPPLFIHQAIKGKIMRMNYGGISIRFELDNGIGVTLALLEKDTELLPLGTRFMKPMGGAE